MMVALLNDPIVYDYIEKGCSPVHDHCIKNGLNMNFPLISETLPPTTIDPSRWHSVWTNMENKINYQKKYNCSVDINVFQYAEHVHPNQAKAKQKNYSPHFNSQNEMRVNVTSWGILFIPVPKLFR